MAFNAMSQLYPKIFNTRKCCIHHFWMDTLKKEISLDVKVTLNLIDISNKQADH